MLTENMKKWIKESTSYNLKDEEVNKKLELVSLMIKEFKEIPEIFNFADEAQSYLIEESRDRTFMKEESKRFFKEE